MGSVGKDGRKLNMWITLVIWSVLCVVCMACMLVVAADKTIVIEDAAQEQWGLSAEKGRTGLESEVLLELQEARDSEGQLCIPLAEGTKAEQVIVENRYAEQELWIYIEKAEESFYQQHAITGDVAPVRRGWYEVQKDGILLKLQMDTVWEYHSTMEGGNLKIAFCDPRDTYQYIVVLDPVGGGAENGITAGSYTEKEVALQVAKSAQKKVELPDIKIYITRSEDVEVSAEQRIRLVQAVRPDLFLQIGVSECNEDTAQYGIQAYYNDEYFIPEFGNIEWADVVTKKVTVAASNRALGLFPANEDSILAQLDMPAAAVSLGYFSNEQERELLMQESYREKLAAGIAEAILEVYTDE